MKKLILLFMCLFSNFAFGAEWKILSDQSKLTFAGTQNNAPVSGEFKKFTGEINFDPEHLDTSKIKIIVDIGSVFASYQDVADTLKTSDWFDVKLFPQATFQANKFTKTGNNAYNTMGTLTIRDKTQPVELNFIIDSYTQAMAKAHGSTNIKRSLFGIGKGEWSSTDTVKDDVTVNFVLTATK